MRSSFLLAVMVLALGLSSSVHAQSLADAAAAETVRRGAMPISASNPAPATPAKKVYSNKDLPVMTAPEPVLPPMPPLPPEFADAAEKGEGQSLAVTMCQLFVDRRLKAPGSARYPPAASQTVVANGAGSYTVSAFVDSQNGFGALLRSNYACKVVWEGDIKWRVQSLYLAKN